MKRSYAFLTIAVICFAIFAASYVSVSTLQDISYRELLAEREPVQESWLTLGNISGLCGIVSLMIQLWQWRRERT
jgi:hypothetical protein